MIVHRLLNAHHAGLGLLHTVDELTITFLGLSFLHSWRTVERFATCPLPDAKEIDAVRTSPLVVYLTPRDRDFAWFLQAITVLADYYPHLKACGFLNDSFYSTIARDPRLTNNDEIMRQFDCLTPTHFRLAFALCQHLYVRTLNTDGSRGGLKAVIRRGICVLYHYVFCFIGGGGEAAIIRQIDQLKDVRVRPVDTDDERHLWCLERFEQDHGGSRPTPRFIVYVPWTQFLSAVGRKYGACPLDNGYACVVYTQVAHWVAERWKTVVAAWQRHDHEIIDPWYIHQYAIHKQTIIATGAEMGWYSGPFIVWKRRYHAEHFYNPARTKLLNADFLRRADSDHASALLPVYKKVFAVGRVLDIQARHDHQRQSAQGTLDMRNEAETGRFIDDYGDIMPPCILYMYKLAVARNTHFKNDDRLTFFSWAFIAGIPLASVDAMWSDMCSKDTQIKPGDVAALLATPANLYTFYSSKRESGVTYNFKGCAKMEHYCVFNDIEDLLDRKTKCSTGVCSGRRPPAPEKWSPMLATIIRHKQKKESHGDLVGSASRPASPADH